MEYKNYRIYPRCFPDPEASGLFVPVAIICWTPLTADDPGAEEIHPDCRCATRAEAEAVATESAKAWIDDRESKKEP